MVAAVPHAAYRRLSLSDLTRHLAPGGLVVDVKDIWRDAAPPRRAGDLAAVEIPSDLRTRNLCHGSV